MQRVYEGSRALKIFEESIKAEKTKSLYKDCLDKFLGWANKDHESILRLSSKELQILLEDYVIFLKEDKGFSTISLAMYAIGKFLEMNDKEFKKSKLKRLLPERHKTAGKKAYTTEEINTMLEFADTLRNKALIHFLCASGCRPGLITELKWKHLMEMPENCYAITGYAGSTREYTTFLHFEARKALDLYKEENLPNNPESFVFPNLRSLKPEPMNSKAVDSVIARIIEKAKIQRIRSEGSESRYEKALTYGFRKRFNTILKNNPKISYAIAQRLMDHKAYLEEEYHDTSDINKFFGEYYKAIPDLIIDEEVRLTEANNAKDKTIKKLQSGNPEFIQLKNQLEEQKERLDNYDRVFNEIMKLNNQKAR